MSRAKIGIIYSDDEKYSEESLNLAKYYSSILVATGELTVLALFSNKICNKFSPWYFSNKYN